MKDNTSMTRAYEGMAVGTAVVCLVGATWWSQHLGWLVLIAFMPLWWLIIRMPLCVGWRSGLIWGAAVSAAHLNWLTLLVYRHAHGQWRMAAPVIMIGYLAVQIGCFFALAAAGARAMVRLPLSTALRQLLSCLVWWLVLSACVWWICHAVLWPFGGMQGYMLFNPVLLLGEYTWWVHRVGHVSLTVQCMGLLAVQGVVVAVMTECSGKVRTGMVMLLLVFVALLMMHHKTSHDFLPALPPAFLASVRWLTLPSCTVTTQDCADAINAALAQLPCDSGEEFLIVTPESLYPFPLNHDLSEVERWSDNPSMRRATLAVGSYRCVQEEKEQGARISATYNSLFIVHSGRIMQTYDKLQPFPICENLIWPWTSITWIRNLFLEKKIMISSNQKVRRPFHALNQTWYPQLCSELFFLQDLVSIRALGPDVILLFCVQERWFEPRYIRRLFFLWTRLLARRLARDILYVGDRQCMYHCSYPSHSYTIMHSDASCAGGRTEFDL